MESNEIEGNRKELNGIEGNRMELSGNGIAMHGPCGSLALMHPLCIMHVCHVHMCLLCIMHVCHAHMYRLCIMHVRHVRMCRACAASIQARQRMPEVSRAVEWSASSMSAMHLCHTCAPHPDFVSVFTAW
jgi:hypothetical protein